MLLVASAVLELLFLSSAASEPWDYSCKSALDDVESAADDAQRAQRSVQDSYERYKRTLSDHTMEQRLTAILAHVLGHSRGSPVDLSGSSKPGSLPSETSPAAGGKQARGVAPSRTCRLIKAMEGRSTEEQVLAFCKRVGVMEPECRRCMQ